MERNRIELFVFLALLLGTIILVVFMSLSYINTIALAAIFAFLFSGLFNRLTRIVKNRSFAAFLMTVIVFVIILLPLSWVGYQVAQEAGTMYSSLRSPASGARIGTLLHQVQTTTRSYLPVARLDTQAVNERLQQVLGWIVGNLGSVFTGVTRIVLQFFFFLLFFYYMLRDGTRLKRWLMELSPLSNAREQQIVDRIALAINGTIRGQIIVSILQGIIAGLGFAFFSVPNPALWGCIVVLASFIPLVGTAIVLIPAILYLAATGPLASAIGLTVWGIVAVGLLDNVLGPKLMSRGTLLHPMVTMVAVLGGISMFGPVGILLGPILMSILFALFNIYLSIVRSPEKS